MTKKELAIALHDKGYNCCQAVVCAFKDELGIDEEILFKAGEGFGFGMGSSHGTCGAVSGARFSSASEGIQVNSGTTLVRSSRRLGDWEARISRPFIA